MSKSFFETLAFVFALVVVMAAIVAIDLPESKAPCGETERLFAQNIPNCR